VESPIRDNFKSDSEFAIARGGTRMLQRVPDLGLIIHRAGMYFGPRERAGRVSVSLAWLREPRRAWPRRSCASNATYTHTHKEREREEDSRV